MIALIGKKLGMTQIFDDRAELIPITVIRFNANYVLGVKPNTANDSGGEFRPMVQLATNATTVKHLSKAQQGAYTAHGIPLQRDMAEFSDFDAPCKIGDTLTVSLFKDVGYVDVIGWCKGKGYQGVVRRYGFGGGRASHGSKFHRDIGSTGMAAYPSKTLKNTKMAGRMPVRRVTVQNMRVVAIDDQQNIMMVQGAIPGPAGRTVIARTAIKRTGEL